MVQVWTWKANKEEEEGGEEAGGRAETTYHRFCMEDVQQTADIRRGLVVYDSGELIATRLRTPGDSDPQFIRGAALRGDLVPPKQLLLPHPPTLFVFCVVLIFTRKEWKRGKQWLPRREGPLARCHNRRGGSPEGTRSESVASCPLTWSNPFRTNFNSLIFEDLQNLVLAS